MEIVRTIHPVGQGAFYSERLETSDGNVYNIVYDCGAGMRFKITEWGENIVKTTRFDNDTIDILFLSHFHADHINGVKILLNNNIKIKNVVIPFLNRQDVEYLITIQRNIGDILNDDSTKIINPFEVFGDSHIIMVNPNDEEEREFVLEGLENRAMTTIPSKSKIKIAEWCYRPFNIPVEFNRESIEKELENNGIVITDLAWLSDSKKVKKVKSIWENINKKINDTSLMVFSYPISDEYDFRCHHCHFPCQTEYYIPYYSCFHCSPSCLYTGDITLKNVLSLIGVITQGHNVGTLQVPHHGASSSWDSHASSIGRVKFLSYGINNKYKHPANSVVCGIMQRDVLYCVNECVMSMMRQCFF